MEVMEAIKTRRSVRDFKGGEVAIGDVNAILTGVQQAPSPSNIQPWKCIVLSKSKVERIAEMIRSGSLDGLPELYRNKALEAFDNISYAIIVIQTHPGAQCGRSLGAAIQNMLLISHSIGLGSVWIEMEPILKLAKEVLRENNMQDANVVALIPVGHPAEVQQDIMDRTRKKIDDFVTYL